MYKVVHTSIKDLEHPYGKLYETPDEAQSFIDAQPDSDWWIYTNVTPQNDPAPMCNFLVFEAQEVEEDIPVHEISRGYTPDRKLRYNRIVKNLFNSFPIAVRATDENEAVKAVMATTRRISKYAVIPAVFIDFTQELDSPTSIRAELIAGN